MKFCKKCHKRVLTTERFVGHRNYVWEGDKFCKCNIHVVGNDYSSKMVVQHRMGTKKHRIKEIVH